MNLPATPPERKFQRGQRVFCQLYSGVFEVIGYTNNLPTSPVFIRDANFPTTMTYDVPESSLTLVED